MNQQMKYELAVFDFDGTLADTFPWFMSIINSVADKYSFKQVLPHEVEEVRTLGARDIMRRLKVPAWKLPFIVRHMRHLASVERANFRVFPGIAEALRDLSRQGVTIGVVSSNSEANVRGVLGPELCANVHFACGASVFGKPRKLAKIIRRTKSRPQSTIYVGDEIRDWQSTKAVGASFGAASWGYTAPQALAACNPDFFFQDPADIPLLIGAGQPQA